MVKSTSETNFVIDLFNQIHGQTDGADTDSLVVIAQQTIELAMTVADEIEGLDRSALPRELKAAKTALRAASTTFSTLTS